MEALQQDKNETTKLGKHGEFDMADDGYELEETREGTGTVCRHGRYLKRILIRLQSGSRGHTHEGALRPSGIAQQLRCPIDHSAYDQHSDAMNIDDFIVPSSVVSSAGVAACGQAASTVRARDSLWLDCVKVSEVLVINRCNARYLGMC